MKNGKNGNGKLERQESEESLDECELEDLIPTPPDGGWGWMIVLASVVCNIIVDGIGYAFGVLLPIFADYFQAPKGQVSLVGSLLVGVYLCAGPIVSGMVNKFGCRAVTIAGSVVASVGFILGSFAPNLNILILTYGVLGGFGFGMIYLPSIVSVGYYFEKKRAIATGIAVCGSGIGTFIFSPLNDFLLDIFDWRNLLFLQAGIILNCAVCAALMRPLVPKKKKRHTEEEKEEIRHHFKINAQTSRRHVTESESSCQDVKTFAKLREAKLMREQKLNEEESDMGSMPSEYFIKGQSESTPGSPVGNPKLIVGSNGPVVDDESHKSALTSTDAADEKQESTGEQKRMSKGQVSISLAVHEVQPLIENGYTKVKERKSQHNLPVGSQSRLGSYRDIVAHKQDFARPLYKKDIFYSGSIVHIPAPDMGSYIASITSIPGVTELPKSSIWDKCICLPKSVTDTLKEMLDFSLLLDFKFAMLCLGNLFAMSGFYVPFTYLVDRATLVGIPGTQAAFLLSVIGITNTIGRILSGLLADTKRVDALVINNVALVISGISLFLEPLCNTYETLIIFSVVYGLCVSAYISLTSIILCDLLGLSKLTNAFGLLTLCRGIAGIYGPPLAGAVFTATGNYDASFYLGGGLFMVGTAFHLVLHLPCAKKINTPDTELDVISNNAGDQPVAV